ncbi:hypothetical protein N6H05_18735 [Sphingobium sp. WTD-1]|uniref:hypothetical protein n=1 Tax=Sphingobium sp. WTD-1 TaxID=2979467 RepID=UPI0024DEDC13|nr:hypothetical protein [Sphingobium sp. WTD-1]WIA55054.1 hypothetical protein N6H05_18735 [Sphingobium sp. WTD-1]
MDVAEAGVWATIGVGCAAAFVGIVQALIYGQQLRVQKQANKQALFDRRIEVYSATKKLVEIYIESEGYQIKDAQFERLMLEAKCVFSKEVQAAFQSVENQLRKHRSGIPEIEYNLYGEIKPSTYVGGPALIAKLKSSMSSLATEVMYDLNLA